ncbi:MAG: hypothetical protein QOI20_2720, partial [Acidimicrobiaceae bacterium]|nr:hypothetical protein [Acidimicrobiaceae bacterium]
MADATRAGRAPAEAVTAPAVAPPVVHRVLAEPGHPLPEAVAQKMGERLHADFSDVRVHTNGQAALSAQAVGAAAYTVGRHIAFAPGHYAPDGPAGQRLLGHELVHAAQQGNVRRTPGPAERIEVGPESDAFEHDASEHDASEHEAARRARPTSGLRLQRQPGPADPDAQLAATVDTALADYEKSAGRPPGAWLRTWAHDYEVARRSAPDAPPLSGAVLVTAAEFRRIHNTEPPLPKAAQPRKLPAGGIPANEVVPFKKGAKLLLTDLTRTLLRNYAGLIGTAKAMGQIPADITDLLDILLDPKTPLSLDAVVTESNDLVWRAAVKVPDLPSKGLKARTVDIALEATDEASTFDLTVAWGNGHQVFDVKARRDGGGIVLSTTVKGIAVDARLSSTPTGGVVASAALPSDVQKWLGASSLKLVRIEPLADSTPAGAAKEREATERKAVASASSPPRQEVAVGAGVTLGPVTPALSVGWRFTFRLLGDAVAAPVAVQVDYLGRSSQALGGVSTGLQGRVPVAGVPVALSVLGGVKAGVAGVGTGSTAPVLGPSVGVRGSIDISPKVRVYLGYEYFHNLVDESQKKG